MDSPTSKLLLHSRPIDRKAADVVHGESVHYEPALLKLCPRPGGKTWEAPPLSAVPLHRRMTDLCSKKVRNVTAVQHQSDHHWLVRCDCGRFELRTEEWLRRWAGNTERLQGLGECALCEAKLRASGAPWPYWSDEAMAEKRKRSDAKHRDARLKKISAMGGWSNSTQSGRKTKPGADHSVVCAEDRR